MLILILISLASTVSGFDFYKRCLLHQGRCVNHCPREMHPYHTRCDRDTLSQRTCDSPTVYSLGYTCGWSRCDCNGDLVLDEVSGQCTALRACPVTTHRERKRGEKKPRRKGQPKMKKKIRYSEGDIPDME